MQNNTSAIITAKVSPLTSSVQCKMAKGQQVADLRAAGSVTHTGTHTVYSVTAAQRTGRHLLTSARPRLPVWARGNNDPAEAEPAPLAAALACDASGPGRPNLKPASESALLS